MKSCLQLFGLPSVNWYSNFSSKLLRLILSDSWKNSPIVAMILLAGMTGISRELYNAAAIDGAGPVRRFFYVTLPNHRNFILIALVIRGISEFNISALTLVLVGYTPPFLASLAYVVDSTTSSIYYSYAASTILLAVVLVFALVALKLRRIA